MDEHRLTELLREAVRETPPASFGVRDIVAAYRRQRERHRRMRMAGGAVVALGVLVAGVAFGLAEGDRGTTSAQAVTSGPAPGSSSSAVAPMLIPHMGQTFQSARNGCGSADARLAAALADELGGADRLESAPVDLTCPPGSSSAAFLVHDGAAVGLFTVVLLSTPDPPTGIAGRPNTVQADVRTGSGGHLVVLSEPAAGTSGAPYASRVTDVAQRLAGRF